jgi:hypothetical protein
MGLDVMRGEKYTSYNLLQINIRLWGITGSKEMLAHNIYQFFSTM